MRINYFINRIKSNKAVTGVDIAISITILLIFTGLIANLIYASYKLAVDTQINAKADAFATAILEKVDEKSFDDVTSSFYEDLLDNDELDRDNFSSYNVNISTETFGNYKINDEDVFKKVTLTLTYDKDQKQIIISKLKVREMGE